MRGSENPNFVSTALCDQAKGSTIHRAAALQEERAGGREHPSEFNAAVMSHGMCVPYTCEVRVILPQTGNGNQSKCVHGHGSE